MSNKREWKNRVFTCAWLFVIYVSVVDGYLVLRFRDYIMDYEQNPVGRALLSLTNGHVWLLLLLKLLGTILACAWLLVIYRRNPKTGLAVVIPVTFMQLVLLIYLHWK